MKENNKTLNEQIGERLKKLRKEKHMTQDILSSKLNLSIPTYSRYETGCSSIPLEIIVSICKYFKVTTDYLLMGIEDEFSPDRRITKELFTMNQKDKETVHSFLTAIAKSLKDDSNK